MPGNRDGFALRHVQQPPETVLRLYGGHGFHRLIPDKTS